MGVVDGAAHTQKDYVESNRGSLENVAKVFVLFLCSVQLALRSGVLTVLDLDSRWMSRQVLLRSLGRCCLGLVAVLVAGGAAGVLTVILNCPLPLRRTHPLTFVCCFCVFAAMGVTSTKSGRLEINLSLSEKRGGAIWELFYFQLFQEFGDFAWSSVRCCLYPWRQCMILRSLFF